MSSLVRNLLRGFVAVCIAAAYPTAALAQDAAPEASEAKTPALPALNSFVPMATSLGDGLESLKRRLQDLPDGGATDKVFKEIDAALDRVNQQVLELKPREFSNTNRLIEIRTFLRSEAERIQKESERIGDGLKLIQAALNEWSEEKLKWTQWRNSLAGDEMFPSVQGVFNSAYTTIESAENLLVKKIQPLIDRQQAAWKLQRRLNALVAEVDKQTLVIRDKTFGAASPLLFSATYFHQLPRALADELPKSIRSTPLPDRTFFARQGWIILIQVALAAAVVVFFRRYAAFLSQSDRTRLFTRRPVSTAIFVSLVLVTGFYQIMPSAWLLLISFVVAIAAVRIISGLVRNKYEKRLIYGLLAIKIFMNATEAFNIPLPLLRLFVFSLALSGIAACLPPLRKAIRDGRTLRVWSYSAIQIVLVVVLGAEFLGFSKLGQYLFNSSLETVMLIISAWILILFLKSMTELVLRSRRLQNVPILRANTDSILSKTSFIYHVTVGTLALLEILSRWKVFAATREALSSLFAFGVTIGNVQITIGLILAALLVLYAAFIVSWLLQALLMEGILTRRQVDTGVRISIARLMHYAVVLIGFITALAVLGFELRNITIIGGALGVGIGFGLQTVVNNFVCGLVMLFERPIKVGDVIELDGNYGEIKRVGLRATVVQTYDNAELVVPNADLITNRLTNWTLAERRMRLRLPVGVAYGSDVSLVMQTLLAAAEAHPLVLQTPKPQVVFLGFGESSLDFDLRVWIANFDNSISARSELNQEIDRRFRENGIEIPFPQRDLHLRSVAVPVGNALSENLPGPPVPQPSEPEEQKKKN